MVGSARRRGKGLLVAIVLIVATSVPGTLLENSIGTDAAGWTTLRMVTLPLMCLLVASLAGDRELTLREAFRLPAGWPRSG